MLKRFSAIVIAIGLLNGCQPAVVSTPAVSPPVVSPTVEREKKDVHVHTPGVNVDVERRGNGPAVDVNVQRK